MSGPRRRKAAADERGFSVELKSKQYVKSISLSNGGHEAVLFEGILGELVDLNILEGTVLKVEGTHGTMMLDLSEDELMKVLDKKLQNAPEEE
jgi:hypothetical protein